MSTTLPKVVCEESAGGDEKVREVWALYCRFEQDVPDLAMSTVEVAFLWFAARPFSFLFRISRHSTFQQSAADHPKCRPPAQSCSNPTSVFIDCHRYPQSAVDKDSKRINLPKRINYLSPLPTSSLNHWREFLIVSRPLD